MPTLSDYGLVFDAQYHKDGVVKKTYARIFIRRRGAANNSENIYRPSPPDTRQLELNFE